MELTEEKTKVTISENKNIKAKKYNAKLFPLYKMFSWDLLFYYAINFLFLTQVKGFSASNILLLDGFYTIFKIFFQIPSASLVDKFGKRKCILLGNILVAISIFIVIFSKEMYHVIISYAFMGFGYIIKDLCDSLFLRDCITEKVHPGTAFSKLDGKGSAYWYIFDAITSIACGFLYVFNNYLPMCLCFIMCLISCIIAFAFKPYEDKNTYKTNKSRNYKTYVNDLKIAFRNLLKSNRLKALFLFSGLLTALFAIRSTMANSLFTEIGIKEEYFGIIFAVLSGLSAIGSNFQNIFHKLLKNRLLTYFSMTFSLSLVGIGLISLFSNSFIFVISSVFILYALQYIIKGSYLTIKKRYLNSFSNSAMGAKIYSLNALIENIFSVSLCILCSLLLKVSSTAYAITFIGSIFVIIFIFVLDYMKDKIGLKPEEYKSSDINFTEIR